MDNAKNRMYLPAKRSNEVAYTSIGYLPVQQTAHRETLRKTMEIVKE